MTGFAQLDPFGVAVLPVILAGHFGLGWLYHRGLSHPRWRRTAPATRQRVFFWLGLLAIAAGSAGPLAFAGAGSFATHQVGHVLMRLLGPLMIALAQPWGVIAAALPRRWRRRLAEIATRSPLRVLRHPAAATLLLIGVFYLWHLPALFRQAVDIPALGALAHVTLMLTGLWYFAMLLDPRDPPEGAARGARLLTGVAVVFSNILLGALIALKDSVAYGPAGMHGGLATLSDEAIGGYVIWVPSSILMIVATVLALHGWNRAEERRWAMRHEIMRRSNSAALEFPETAEELWIKVAKPNRVMARTLGLVVVAMFTLVIATAIGVVSGGR